MIGLKCLFLLAFLMMNAQAASTAPFLEAPLRHQEECTVELWVKPAPNCPAGARLVDYCLMSGRSSFLVEMGKQGRVRFLGGTGGEVIESTEALPSNQWSHLVAQISWPRTVDKKPVSGQMQLWVQGKKVGTVDHPQPPPLGSRHGFGLRFGGDYSGGHRFVGDLQRVTVHQRLLTEEEILARRDAPSIAAPALSPAVPVSPAATPQGEYLLSYQQPAFEWVQALPVGNGRLGAMVYGGIQQEVLQLNEDTVWAGGPYDPANPEGLAAMQEGRRLIFAGKGEEAAKLLHAKFNGKPNRGLQYQPLGRLLLDFPQSTAPVTNYNRTLDLDSAIARTSYEINGVTYTREVFATAPDQVLVMRLTASKPRSLSFTATLDTLLKNPEVGMDGNCLTLSSISTEAQGIPGQVKTHTRLFAQNQGGTLTLNGKGLVVEKADSVTLLLSAATNYVNWKDLSADPVSRAKAWLEPATGKAYADLRLSHVTDYQKLFRRVSLHLGSGSGSQLPTDERVRNFKNGQDPALAALFFQYGRYLLISSSRPGDQPANLQGIWNDLLTPPWGSKYTININAQMNYWPAEITNLSECHEPLLQMIQELPEPGARTARVMYGAKRGWVAHHNTDGWRATAPIDANDAGIQPLGGAWLCTHLWEHYLFTGDQEFLRKAYPTLKGACEFFLETLVPHPQFKWLVTCPSNSPEIGGVVAGPTMDNAILRDLFAATAEAAKILQIDETFAQELRTTRAKLAPFQIGKWGQLQEWLEDKDDPKSTHRHVSHLYALYPSAQISPATPELFNAARVSLNARGDAGTGWSIAWKINFWARLLDGDRSFGMISNLLGPPGHLGDRFEMEGGTYPNLFDAHPPFQIDGNFGATAGMAELLLQSHAGEIVLLPALPKAWPTGSVKGLCVRGGFVIDLEWKNGALVTAQITSRHGTKTPLRYAQQKIELNLQPGESRTLNTNLQ